MRAAFRWQIVVPRLLFLVILVLALQYGLGRVARWISAGSLESAVHAHVELAHARASLLHRQLVLSDLRLRNHSLPSQNCVEIDRCSLDFATIPLLYKRAVVERGTVSGLRFDTQYNTSETKAGPKRSVANPNWFPDDAAERARSWLQNLDEQFARELLSQFASVQQTEELCARWPKQAAAFDRRVSDIKRRAALLQQSAGAAQANPLRHVAFLQRLPNEVATLRAEFAAIHAELEKLVQSLDSDRRSIVITGRQEDQILRAQLHLDPIDPSLLTAYLLQGQVQGPLNEVVAWLRWIRRVVPARAECGCRTPRGENVLFSGCRPTPSFLIRNLELLGTARIGGQPVELRGTLSDYSNAPPIHSDPIRLRVKAAGSLPLELQATIDRTKSVARDELLVDCRGVVLSELDLGHQDEFQMTIAPSLGSLSISVLVEDEQLSGEIQLVQKQVQMTPAFGCQLTDLPVTAALEDTLTNLDAVATRVTLGGTLNEPTCSLWSNLGTAVAEAMQRALRRAGDQHARALAARAQRHVDERLSALERLIRTQQADMLAQIANSNGELQAMAGQQSHSARISHEQLGRRLPAGSLFR